MKKASFIVMIALMLSACSKDVKLHFETENYNNSSEASIAISYPKASGTKAVADKINQEVEHTIANFMNMADTSDKNISIAKAVSAFDNEYKTFKNEFQDSSQKWEVKIDGDKVYESAEIICLSLQHYVDTGGAHGNGGITYLNFDPETGNLLKQNDILKDLENFKKTAEKAFQEQTKPADDDETIEDFFFGEEFQLPANIGFTSKGLVLLYNNYEIASYAQGITKVVMPYEDIKEFLKVNP